MADIASDLKTWSATASSNSPAGGTAVGTGLDDNLREIQKVVRQDLATKGADIASAGTTDVGAVAGYMHDITGTTSITSLGTVSAGITKILKFEGILTLTHNATSLILPSGANITTADGDIGIFISEGSGNWRCVSYVPATGLAIKRDTTAASTTVAGIIEIADQTEVEAATSALVAVPPSLIQNHPGVVKFWCNFDGTGTPAARASYNLSGIVDNGVGDWSLTIGTDFSSANWLPIVSLGIDIETGLVNVLVGTISAGSMPVRTARASAVNNITFTFYDSPQIYAAGMGYQ